MIQTILDELTKHNDCKYDKEKTTLGSEIAQPMLKNQYSQYLLRVIEKKKEEINSDL